MQIDNDLFVHIAELSMLSFSDEEKQALSSELNEFFVFLKQLNEVDTRNISPLITPGRESHFRDDSISESLSRSCFIKNIPCSFNGYIEIPTVLNQNKPEE